MPRASLLALCLARAALALPWPSALFYPSDPLVGDVARANASALAARVAGKHALVVGGTDGIGRAAALALARAGGSVTVVGHSAAKAAAMRRDLAAAGGEHHAAFAADLSTVRGCLAWIRELTAGGARPRGLGFDFVVLTVGVWPDWAAPLSRDGVDKVLALDVLARFVIARELRPWLNRGGRLLSVLGSTVRLPPAPAAARLRAIATRAATDYGLAEILGTAGVLGDAWLQRFAREAPGLAVMGTWPGVVGDDLVAHSKTFPPWLRPFLAAGGRLVGTPTAEAGAAQVQILTAPNAGRRPVSYFNCELEGRLTNPLAYDGAFQDWAWSFLTETAKNHTLGEAGPGTLMV